jgi:hypothetical protein
MKKRLIILCASLLLIMGISIVSGSTAAFASPVQASAQHSTITLAQEVQNIQREELLLKPHLHLNTQNGTVSLDIQNGRSIGMDQKTFAYFAQSVREYNAAVHTVKNSSAALLPASTGHSTSQSLVPAFSCYANSYLVNHGRGNYTFDLSECETQVIIAASGVAAGVLTIAAAIAGIFAIVFPAAAVPLGYLVAALGIAAGIFAVGFGVLLITDIVNGNNGLYFSFHLGNGKTNFTGWGAR